jgi:hypothetical protein
LAAQSKWVADQMLGGQLLSSEGAGVVVP